MSESTCPGAGCIDGPVIDGLCLEHYIEPFLPLAAAFKPRTKAPAIVRFLHYVDMSGGPDACWPYTNSIHPAGYATFFDKGRKPPLVNAHRWAYEHFIGQVHRGTGVSHACCTEDCAARGPGDPHNRCVNPRHLMVPEPVPPRYTYDCARCGETFGAKYLTTGDRAFCSMECRSGARMVTKTCPVCGEDFTIALSNEDRYQTCSMACKNKDTEYLNCKRCGKRFAPRHNNSKHYCSDACRRPVLMMACHNCGREFRTHPSDVNRRFCSIPCVRQFMGETRLEARVRVALEMLGVGFVQEYPFGRWSIDFAIPERKVAVEADGDYWHKILARRDAKRDAHMKASGWKVVRLAERDVNSVPNLGQFILARVREITGLELADIAGPSRAGSRQSRPKFQLGHRSSRPAEGQMPLWG